MDGRSAALLASLRSGTSYLANPVEATFGHAAARSLAEATQTRTGNEGFWLLTRDHMGGIKSLEKPFRWRSLRRVP